jgi:hypothetical protein
LAPNRPSDHWDLWCPTELSPVIGIQSLGSALGAAVLHPARSGGAGEIVSLPYLLGRGTSRAPWSKRLIPRPLRPLLQVAGQWVQEAGPQPFNTTYAEGSADVLDALQTLGIMMPRPIPADWGRARWIPTRRGPSCKRWRCPSTR